MRPIQLIALTGVAFGVGALSALWSAQVHDNPQPSATALTDLADAAEDTDYAIDSGPSPADLNFNPGWIGAACRSDDDCPYEQGFCLLDEEGFPGGTCTRRCQKFCPDKKGALYATTFCVEDPKTSGDGLCLARCNLHLTTSGCRPGYVCTTMFRLNSAQANLVCQPEQGSPAPPTACTKQLDALGLHYSRLDLVDALARAAKDGDPLPQQDSCQVDTPILLASPVHHVDFREQGQQFPEHLLVSCRFALAVDRLAEFVDKRGIVEVEHLGAYNCRGISGSRKLSAHGLGLALDVAGFEPQEGAHISVLNDWNSKDPQRRQAIRQLVKDLRASRIFDVVLAPDSDKDHKNHLHLALRP